MSDPSERSPERLSEALREAVQRTIAATAGGAEETRRRGIELLDEVTRRGAAAGQGAREVVSERIEQLERRLEALERSLRGEAAEPEPGPEPERDAGPGPGAE